MAYTPEKNLDKWLEVKPKVMECLEAGLTLPEFLEYMGWEKKQWYHVKPINFNWAGQLRSLGNKLKKPADKKLKSRRELNRKRMEICRRFGVQNLGQIGCTSVADYNKKIKQGEVIEKKPLKDSPAAETTITGHVIAHGKAMLVICNTSEISQILKGVKKGLHHER